MTLYLETNKPEALEVLRFAPYIPGGSHYVTKVCMDFVVQRSKTDTMLY